MSFRIEKDSMGEIKVPSDALYGAQTQRAINNFHISGKAMPVEFIHAVTLVKKAAALTNRDLGILEDDKASGIISACDEILAGSHLEQFPVDIYQTGSGTSTNMNVNEVIASLANRGKDLGVGANDHVNMSQSSNDTIPTAIQISAAVAVKEHLLPSLDFLIDEIEKKIKEVGDHCKTGRTHLMDAMPLTLGQEMDTWKNQLIHGKNRIEDVMKRLCKIPQGGTAIGTGINAHQDFAANFAKNLSTLVKIDFQPLTSLFEGIASQDAVVELSGQLKTLAVSMMKIGNDLRWMNSGPLAGLSEIELEALQPGSSIMPGKVNPVIPEAMVMVCAKVIGNDSTITIGGQSGNFQLNVMLPVIADTVLESIRLLGNAVKAMGEKAVRTFKVNKESLDASLGRNPILVTALNPVIGYMKAAEIAKKAYKEKRFVIDVAEEMTDLSRQELERLLNPADMTRGGIKE